MMSAPFQALFIHDLPNSFFEEGKIMAGWSQISVMHFCSSFPVALSQISNRVF
jgi:hypothetical protein